jgi:uncharacterized protein (TIGR02757 family)
LVVFIAFENTFVFSEQRMKPSYNPNLHQLLEQKYQQYNQPNFIANDPISIPHLFSKKQDIEIMGLFAAILAWGQRKTIIAKCKELLKLFGHSPHDFIVNHQPAHLQALTQFKHRTFNATDLLYFVHFLQQYYQKQHSLEQAFLPKTGSESIESGLVAFHNTFFDSPYAPTRTRKHLSTPLRKSACKRLCMYLRWMVRADGQGVDFGLWQQIKPEQLVCPCDVHVDRTARHIGLIARPQTDWLTAIQLTQNLKIYDPADPVKYDFALFGMGIENYWEL